ncbi:hypothetical protein C0995_012108 [Termitomyces sp. Mi166|nr:hypothetical protein C0995_012108 [Termitomyces sp. Mi166\
MKERLQLLAPNTMRVSKTQHFLNNLGVSDIAEAIEDITTGLVALQEHKSKIDIADTMVTLDNLTSELLSNTDQHGAPALAIQVSHIWNSIQDLERHIDISGAEKRLAQSLVILAFMSPYHWLFQLIKEASMHLNAPVDDPNWMLLLLQHLDNIHNRNGQLKDRITHFHPSQFISGLQAEPYHYTPPCFNPDPVIIMTFNQRAAIAIAESWLGFYKDAHAKDKFHLLNLLRDHIGSHSIFALDCIWKVFKNPMGMLTDTSHRTSQLRTLSDAIKELEIALETHPLIDNASIESDHL